MQAERTCGSHARRLPPSSRRGKKRLCEDLAGSTVAGCSSSQVKRCRREAEKRTSWSGNKGECGEERKHGGTCEEPDGGREGLPRGHAESNIQQIISWFVTVCWNSVPTVPCRCALVGPHRAAGSDASGPSVEGPKVQTARERELYF